jgi:hypothetical protein
LPIIKHELPVSRSGQVSGSNPDPILNRYVYLRMTERKIQDVFIEKTIEVFEKGENNQRTKKFADSSQK